MSKFSAKDIRAIRASYARGISVKELAGRYGMSLNNARVIVKRRRWRHI